MQSDLQYPQFIRVDAEVKKNFLDPLINQPNSLFYKRELGDVYFLAASLGYKDGKKKKTVKPSDLRLYATTNERYKLLIRAIVLATEKYNYDVLLDGNKTLKIVEEYANGGASVLYEKIFKGKGLDFSIEDEIWDELRKH